MGELMVAKPAARDKEESQYLTFLLGSEMFGIEILTIKEIIEYSEVTAVPMMPSFVRGVINVRGAVVPVVDLSSRFGRKVSEVTRRSCIVIIEAAVQGGDQQDMGMLVDAVSAVMEIPATEIEPAPSFGSKIRVEFISGMAKVNGKFVILLNVEKVLSIEEMAMLADVANTVS